MNKSSNQVTIRPVINRKTRSKNSAERLNINIGVSTKVKEEGRKSKILLIGDEAAKNICSILGLYTIS